MNKQQIDDIVSKIKAGQVGVMPTDTIFGIVASAHNKDAIERVYTETGRPKNKAYIVLVGDIAQLRELHISVPSDRILEAIWPGPVSVIMDCNDKSMDYLHRGLKSIAVRLPDKEWLRELVNKTGPIIATSANMSGVPTPTEVELIKKQLPNFDFYINGPTGSAPSRLCRLNADKTLTWLERS